MAKNTKKPVVHQVQMIEADLLFEHPNNTNRQSKHVQNELVESILQNGMDENLIVVPRKDGPGYYIVSGNHRFRAGKVAGLDAFPAVVRDDWDEIEARIQLVRRNYVRGTIDKNLFTAEVNRLQEEHAIGMGIIMDRMGFEDPEAFANLYKEEKQRAVAVEEALKAQESASKVKMVDDLGAVVSAIFEQYGSTVPHSFIIFPQGGKNHLFVQSTPSLKKALDSIATKCMADGLDINTILGGLLQIGMHNTSFFAKKDNEANVERIKKEGTMTGSTSLDLIEDEQ